MCDYFDMACRDASSALQLNIKVNSENLLPHSQKYNVGSLRLPADPSWPKIPQRRLADDLGEIIEPPCVVTLTGTPRKSRTTVRPSPSYRSTKPTFSKDQVPASFHNVYQKVTTPSHPLKRRPGCADPRFKRVTTVKSQMTPSDPLNRDRENPTEQSHSALDIPNQTQCATENVRKTIPEKDTDPPKVTQREAEKPGEIRGMDSVGVQTIPTEDATSIDDLKNHLGDVEISKEHEEAKKIIDDKGETESRELALNENSDEKIESNLIVEKPCSDAKSCEEHGENEKSTTNNRNAQKEQKIYCAKEENSIHNLTIVPNTHINVQPESACLQYCQGNAGQFFLVVENKVQAPSLSAIQIDPSPVSSCQYTTQCYNVQVPVLSYQNLPLQISSQTTKKVDVPAQLSLSPVVTIPSSPSLKNPANLSVDVANAKFSGTSEEIKNVPLSVTTKRSTTVPEPAIRIGSDDTTTGFHRSQSHEKNKGLIHTDVDVDETRKMLVTPPIKLEREHEDNCKFDDLPFDSDVMDKNFEKRLVSDTTDSELYDLEVIQSKIKRNRLKANETSCSGSDCDYQFNHQSKFNKNDVAETKKKRRKPISCNKNAMMCQEEMIYSRNYEAQCSRTRESWMEDKGSSIPPTDGKTASRANRKMKSEQNLPRSLPFGGNRYKNISDPHITLRESYGDGEDGLISYPSSYGNPRRKHENRFVGNVVDEINEISCNHENTDRTTDEIDSDAFNVPTCCDTHRTDLSNIEETKKLNDLPTLDKPTTLPVKTQQLLNKSYMEYYDKIRSRSIEKNESAKQRYVCQMAMGAPQLKKRRAEINGESEKFNQQKETPTEILTLEKLSALSNIINRNLNTDEKNANDATQTKQLYVNENMKSSSDPTAGTQSAVLRGITAGESADLYDSSVPSSTLINKVKRKREKPVERRLLKLKTIAFFGFMMYAMIVLLPMMYNYFLYDEYDDYEDLSYIELMLEYVVSSFREAFGGLFDTINDLFFRPVRHD